MPDESQPPSESNPPFEPTRLASSDHPSGDTWRLEQTPLVPGVGGPADAPSRPAEVIGDFEVVGKLGQGGMGTVYRALQRSLQRLVALKILPGRLEADSEYVARFQREARVAASLTHPNLVRVYTSGSAAGCHYIAMELIEGETLADWLKRGPVPPLEAMRIVLAVTHALECGWRTAHLIHRDIKPGNIFLSREGAVKLGDLGLAKTIGNDTSGLTQTGTMMGTPHYISPEQARGDRDLDFRADIYSLGCTLYQMLTGQTPYHGGDALAVMSMHLNAPPPAILKALPQCPIPLARLVGKMLKKQRRERHASYEELIAQLESVQALLDPALAAARVLPAAATAEVGMPRRGVQHEATRPTDTQGRRGAPSLSKKSPVALYIGIAAIVLVIAGYFLWPKEEKLTAAQRWAREHASDKKAETESNAVGGVSDSTGPASTKPAATTPAPAWQPFATDADWKATTDKHEFKDELLHLHGGLAKSQPTADGAIRARIRITADTINPQLGIRSFSDQGAYKFVLNNGYGDVVLNFYNRAKKETIPLGHYKLPNPLDPGDMLPMELRVQGSHLTAKLYDTPVIEVDDQRLTEPGEWTLSGESAWYESAEVLALPAPAGTGWQPLFTDAEWRKDVPGRREFKDGLLHLVGSGLGKPQPSADGAIRTRIRLREGTSVPSVMLRHLDGEGQYSLVLQHDWKKVNLDFNQGSEHQQLGSFTLPQPLQPGDTLALELRAEGNHLTGAVNGTLVIDARDERAGKPGSWGISAGDGWFESVEVQPQPAPATSAAAPQAMKLWDKPEKIHVGGAAWENDALRLEKGSPRLNEPRSRDAIIRARIRMNPDANGSQVCLRVQNIDQEDRGGSFYRLVLHAAEQEVGLDVSSRGKGHQIGRWPYPRAYRADEWGLLELRAVGDEFTAALDGQILGVVRDSTLPGAGGVMLFANANGYFRDIEYVPLDAANTGGTRSVVSQTSTGEGGGRVGADKAALSSGTSAAEPWRDVLRDPAELTVSKGMERTADGVRWVGVGSATLKGSNDPQRDGAIRMRAIYSGGLRVQLLARSSSGGVYQLDVADGKTVNMNMWNNVARRSTNLRTFPLPAPLQPGQEYELELRAAGTTLTAKFNGEILGTFTDGTFAQGGFGMAVSQPNPTPTLVKSLEVLNLDEGGGNK